MQDTDVVVIGAGAAGVAAARRLGGTPLTVRVLEARGRIGGRAWTKEVAGLPLDLGCGWLHSADRNEWAAIAAELGFDIDPTPPPWSRPAFESSFPVADQNDFRAVWSHLHERIHRASETAPDRPAAAFLTPGGRWNGLANALSSYINGVELDGLSVRDFGRYHDTGVNWRVVKGYGALIETCAVGLDIVLDCPVTRVDHSGTRVRIVTPRGELFVRAAIITVPPGLLARESLRLAPSLPDKLEAAAALPLGLADKVFLHVDAPDRLPPETRLFGAIDRSATGSYHLRPFGRPVIEGYFGGAFARELEEAGEGAFSRFAIEQLAAHLGHDIRKSLRPLAETAWSRDPCALGSYSYARIGHAEARAVLAAPVDEKLFFAGEACSRHDFSTAHGAYRTGVVAAEQALRALTAPVDRAGAAMP